jgi:acetyl-CoA carboxylase carboxyl transferase subunit alpha
LGGAHNNHQEIFSTVKEEIKKHIAELQKLDPKKRVDLRIEKFCAMGVVEEAN